jgi:hypothetical protein
MTPPAYDKIMNHLAGALESVGFVVSDRNPDDVLEKIIGYEIQRTPARLSLPQKKRVLLAEAFQWVVNRRWVDTSLLHTLLGMWLHGALLRRELLCIPHSLFQMIKRNFRQTVKWWPSALREVKVMLATLPAMFFDAGAPVSKYVFATDAMGSNDVDFGGFGVCMTEPSDDVLRACLDTGAPGLTVARLSGDTSGLKNPHKEIVATKPFTLLPPFCLIK